MCKDGFSSLSAAGYSNYYGVQTIQQGSEKVVTANTATGGWFMVSGVELGKNDKPANQIQLMVTAATACILEIWLDDLTTGQLIATIPVTATGASSNWKAFGKKIRKVTGRHDVFVKFPAGAARSAYIKTIQFK